MIWLNDYKVGLNQKLLLISGNCVIESERTTMETAEALRIATDDLNINLVYKSSFDKANRTSIDSFRGLGMEEGLRILERVKSEFNIPVLTDVHEYTPLDEVASVVDVLQTPSLLVRQTDFIRNVCAQGLPVNIKKGQFQAPEDMIHVVNKVDNENIMVCDRGIVFGYNNLVCDMKSLVIMRDTNKPVIFDASHPSGHRKYVPYLAKAAVAVGISGLFIEVHPEPEKALCDGKTSMSLDNARTLLREVSGRE